jgi:hypothetical protein
VFNDLVLTIKDVTTDTTVSSSTPMIFEKPMESVFNDFVPTSEEIPSDNTVSSSNPMTEKKPM